MAKKVGAGIVLATLVVVAVWYVGVYSKEKKHVESLQTSLTTLQENVQSLDERYLSLVASEKRLPAEEAELSALGQMIPPDPELDSILRRLSATASAAHVHWQSIGTPTPATYTAAAPTSSGSPTATVPVVNIAIAVSGTPENIVRFVGLLSAEKRVFVVDGLTLPAIPGNAKGSAARQTAVESLKIRAFYGNAGSLVPVMPSRGMKS